MVNTVVEVGEIGAVVGFMQGLGTDGLAHAILTDKQGRVKQSHGQPDPFVSGPMTLLNQQAALPMDGFSSFTIMFSGTYTGANVTIEQSLDSTTGIDGTWAPLLVNRPDSIGTITATPLANSSTGVIVYQGQAPGASFVRARLTSNTATGAGVVCRMVASTSPVPNIVGVSGSISTSTGIEPYTTLVDETVTSLGANALYSGPVRDLGSDLSRLKTRVRTVIRHTAGLVPASYYIEESSDNVTFYEVARWPVPSDGYVHSFETTIHTRYYRVRLQNGATAQTACMVKTMAVVAEGNTEDDRLLPFALSQTALALNTAFTGPVFDLGLNHGWNELRAAVFADQPGTLFIEHSRDNATWRGLPGLAVAAGQIVFLASPIHMRYVRVRYLNGATANTVFDLNATLVPL